MHTLPSDYDVTEWYPVVVVGLRLGWNNSLYLFAPVLTLLGPVKKGDSLGSGLTGFIYGPAVRVQPAQCGKGKIF